jgi:predicted RNA-binding Zn ribbon-like protein
MVLFERCLTDAAREMSYNTLRGNVRLNPAQKKALTRYKAALRKLAAHSTSQTERKRVVLQKGHGIFSILLPLLASAIPLITNRNG